MKETFNFPNIKITKC